MSHTFDAPLSSVWDAFSDPERMKHWWGPKGFTVRVAKMDFRPGGTYHYCLRSSDGKDMWGKMVYREIVPLQQMVLVNSFSDEKGGLTRHPMNPKWPREMISTFTFTGKAGKTLFSVRWLPLNPSDDERAAFDGNFDSMTQGWRGTLEQLDHYLEDPPLIVERTLKAPVKEVWAAITHKDQMDKWYFHLEGFRPEVGCEFRFQAGKDDKLYLHLCRVAEVDEPRTLSYRWRYDGYEGDSLVTFELFAVDSGTKVRLTHKGLGTFPQSNPDFKKKSFAEGWASIIGTSLRDFVEK